MQLDEAREIAASHGVEEGAQFEWFRMGDEDGDKVGDITVTDLKCSGAGIRNVEFVIEANGKTKEKSMSIRNVARSLQSGWWQEIEK
ncbi:hypothetical protein SAMN05216388_102652 [Halorientalis persicus]|uniref:Uncharacterized protein n=1 Tax=Halorientalis persicus TaxID=1367881 RepID=A0A1H8UAA9_9EURY|nr:hypothetical protein [Halorientalis persicus]SEP00202.1 hypothetical protein SAMN05216388_102652 [Halorientalis persicus]